MKKFRVIYMIEVLDVTNIGSNDVELFARRFARNKKTAEKIVRHYEKVDKDLEIDFRRLSDTEHSWINPADVEG